VVPWETPGDIVRWWRTDVLGWSQQQVADRLSVGSSALSNWEHGTRLISIDIEQIDRALEANGVLAGLLWAFGSRTGLDQGRIWTKVFPGASAPVWAWIRSDHAQLRIEAEWGAFRVEAEVDLGPNGVLVTVGGSIAESPVVFQLSKPGWADFGWGELPATIPGAAVVRALEAVRPSSATGVFMDLFSADLTTRLQRYQTQPRTAHGLNPKAITSFVANFNQVRARGPADPWPAVPEGTDPVDRQRYARLRRARSLSLAQTADRLTTMTDISASKDTLRRFENDQGEPHDRLLPVALDHVLGAEGHLTLIEIRSGQGAGAVRIPFYWRGPVWLAFDGPSADTEIELLWGAWRRRLEGDLPLLLASHYAEPQAPLRILTSRQVQWTVGVGRPAGAVPINHGWAPISVDAAQRLLSETEFAVLDALRRQ
jgi:transcriptional regulator with XRE-family HTH domain